MMKNLFTDFTYWFQVKPTKIVEIYKKDIKHKIGSYDLTTSKIQLLTNDNEEDILADFKKFTSRPEFILGQQIALDGIASNQAQDYYEKLMVGVLSTRAWKAGKNPDDHMDYINRIITWIANTSFYNDPASTIYHESFKHGLLYHTLRVYNKMCELIDISTFSIIDLESATLCCLVHDWCKIGLYESYKRNVKDETTGKWNQVDSYRRGNFPHPAGHGVASAYMVMNMIKLTEEEFLAIRWHMSMFNVSSNEINEYQQACEIYPLIHLLQFADQLSITSY